MFLASAIVPNSQIPETTSLQVFTGFECKTLDWKSDAPLEGKTKTSVYRKPLKIAPFMIL